MRLDISPVVSLQRFFGGAKTLLLDIRLIDMPDETARTWDAGMYSVAGMLSDHRSKKHILPALFRTLFVVLVIQNFSWADADGALASYHDRTGIGTGQVLVLPRRLWHRVLS